MRCLKPSGTLWLNIGDAYNTPINWRTVDSNYSTLGKDRTGHAPDNAIYQKDRGRRRPFLDKNVGWLSYGNLLGIPYRVVLALMDHGWYFRGEVIWEKSRPVPEGRCRRPHRRHEPIYVMAKSERHKFRRSPPVGSVWKLVQQPNLTGHRLSLSGGLADPMHQCGRCCAAGTRSRSVYGKWNDGRRGQNAWSRLARL